MSKFLKLTDGYEDTGLTELVNAEQISNVLPEYEDEGGFFSTKLVVTGSRIVMKNGEETYVKETPEQIATLLEGN